MPFSTNKSEIIALAYTKLYSRRLSTKTCRRSQILRYNHAIQSQVQQTYNQKGKVCQVLVYIKHSLQVAPKEYRLLAYTALCQPILEYGDTLWDPAENSTSNEIELVQNQAIRFIKGKERHN